MLRFRSQSLDGIRGIAIGLVIVHHAFQQIKVQPTDSAFATVISWFATSGWIGVDLFFALSGYLITGILLDSRSQPGYFRLFYMRRFFRIFPLYYSFIGITLFACLFVPAILSRMDLAWNVAYAANFRVALLGWPMRAISHLWSLSVEEQFYLIWPTLILVLPRRYTFSAIIMILVTFLTVRQVGGTSGVSNLAVYGLLHLDGLILGACLAVLIRTYPPEPKAMPVIWLALLTTSAIMTVEAVTTHGLDWQAWSGVSYLNYTLVAAWSVALIAVSIYSELSARINKVLSARVLVAFGKYSYAIYLVHLPLDFILRKLGLHPSTVLKTVPYTAMLSLVALGIALITWNLLEKRCIALKDRWFAYE